MSEYKLVPAIPTMEIVNDIVKAGNGSFGIPTAISLHSAMLASCPDVSSEPFAYVYEWLFEQATEKGELDKWVKGLSFNYPMEKNGSHVFRNIEPLYTHPAPVASEPVAIVDSKEEWETSDNHNPVHWYVDVAWGMNLYTTPQPDKVEELEANIKTLKAENYLLNDAINEDKILVAYAKELEAKLQVAREALQDVVDSGLLNGSCNLHDETSNKVHEALKQIGGTE
jgi:exonuclease VII small subunit